MIAWYKPCLFACLSDKVKLVRATLCSRAIASTGRLALPDGLLFCLIRQSPDSLVTIRNTPKCPLTSIIVHLAKQERRSDGLARIRLLHALSEITLLPFVTHGPCTKHVR